MNQHEYSPRLINDDELPLATNYIEILHLSRAFLVNGNIFSELAFYKDHPSRFSEKKYPIHIADRISSKILDSCRTGICSGNYSEAMRRFQHE